VSKKEYLDDPDAMFVPSEEFVDLVNSDASSTWQAKIHDNFKQYSIRDMMKMIGWRQYHKPSSLPPAIPSANTHYRRTLGDLPTELDWRNMDGKNFVTPVRNQESCGSCYSIAAAAVAESRLLIKDQTLNVNSFKLSPQSVVSCSHYNQGCDGGYPFLVGKHGHDFGLVEESCMPYTGTDSSCSAECGTDNRYFIQDYGYVGGYYGGCSEQAMMEEIQANGPIVVAFNAPGSLFYYNGGIFSCNNIVTESEEQASGSSHVHKWEKTNHAVVAVGWGEEMARNFGSSKTRGVQAGAKMVISASNVVMTRARSNRWVCTWKSMHILPRCPVTPTRPRPPVWRKRHEIFYDGLQMGGLVYLLFGVGASSYSPQHAAVALCERRNIPPYSEPSLMFSVH